MAFPKDVLFCFQLPKQTSTRLRDFLSIFEYVQTFLDSFIGQLQEQESLTQWILAFYCFLGQGHH